MPDVWINLHFSNRQWTAHTLTCHKVLKAETRTKGIGRALENGGWFRMPVSEVWAWCARHYPSLEQEPVSCCRAILPESTNGRDA